MVDEALLLLGVPSAPEQGQLESQPACGIHTPPATTLKQALKDEGDAHSACYILNQSYLHLGYFYLSKLCSHSPENCDLLFKLQALKGKFLQGERQ